MQSGFARTGKKFGYHHYDVNPDMICCGKGMGAGFSLSGVIGSNKVFQNKNIKGLSSTILLIQFPVLQGLPQLRKSKN